MPVQARNPNSAASILIFRDRSFTASSLIALAPLSRRRWTRWRSRTRRPGRSRTSRRGAAPGGWRRFRFGLLLAAEECGYFAQRRHSGGRAEVILPPAPRSREHAAQPQVGHVG